MKELLLQMAKYNLWANKRIIAVLLKLEEEQLDKEMISSFPSLRATAYHIWGAEFLWLQRLQLTEQPVYMPYIYKGTFEDACADWQDVSQILADFTGRQFDDKAFEHVVQYYNSEKKSFKNPVHEILQHVFNHSTYHRGQVVTMLRQAGIDKIPETDLTIYLRKG
ncbi:MAG: hypothetical protein BGO69_17270 [Bacteroidetes bacterium 46-16]|nr:MAG: hypothetical protein BGO69_17270 [Bacteroidetes bacterium 46-16]